MRNLPVIAVIPAHNAAQTIRDLLDELIAQKYDSIYVIDDASTDDTVKIVRSYSENVSLIENSKNVGSGANRNRIIDKTKGSVIHFIDADMRLLSKNTPAIIRKIKWPKNAAYIGGMVRNPDGSQNPFNFGPRPHFLAAAITSPLQFIIWSIGRLNWQAGSILRRLAAPLLVGLPDIYRPARPAYTYWVAESNMLVRAESFARHGGFDPRFRYSEIVDFSTRMHRRGLRGYFNPEIDALHLSWDNVTKSLDKRRKAHRQFLDKHGRLVFYFPPLSDYLAGRKTQKRYHK